MHINLRVTWAVILVLASSLSFAEDVAAPSAPPLAPAGAAEVPAAAVPAAEASPVATPAPSTPAVPTSADKARDALAEKESDASAEKNLEEVFQAAEKQYSLLKAGDISMGYSVSYSYFRADRIDLAVGEGGGISRFMIEQDAQHSFSNSFSFDYGIRDNLTFSTGLPMVVKHDTVKNISGVALGDVSLGLRWQPFSIKRGAPSTTLFGTFSTATGDSPYTINPLTDLSSGKGYYAASFGASSSKVIDPAVVFGSLSYTMAFDVADLNQNRFGRVLTEFHPGDSIGFSFGLAYSLSYDLSINASYSQSYAFQSEYLFSDGSFVGSEDSTSASVSTSVGIRMSPTRIVNVGFGFGLTPESPNVSLSLSLPIDIAGLKK